MSMVFVAVAGYLSSALCFYWGMYKSAPAEKDAPVKLTLVDGGEDAHESRAA